jgi:hypothetical protein
MDASHDEGKIEAEFTPEEAKFLVECVLGCPMQVDVRTMTKVFGMAQNIIRKLTTPSPPPPTSPPAGTLGEGS